MAFSFLAFVFDSSIHGLILGLQTLGYLEFCAKTQRNIPEQNTRRVSNAAKVTILAVFPEQALSMGTEYSS